MLMPTRGMEDVLLLKTTVIGFVILISGLSGCQRASFPEDLDEQRSLREEGQPEKDEVFQFESVGEVDLAVFQGRSNHTFERHCVVLVGDLNSWWSADLFNYHLVFEVPTADGYRFPAFEGFLSRSVDQRLVAGIKANGESLRPEEQNKIQELFESGQLEHYIAIDYLPAISGLGNMEIERVVITSLHNDHFHSYECVDFSFDGYRSVLIPESLRAPHE